MDVSGFLLDPGMRPFAIALGIVAALTVVELVLMQLGGSLIGDGADADLDLDLAAGDADFELDAGFAAEHDLDAAEAPPVTGSASTGGITGWLGIGKVPLSIWIAGVLTGFGLSGYALQLLSVAVWGAQMPAAFAALIALPPGLVMGRWLARAVARIMPKSESQAISRRAAGNRRGVISVGTARRGKPARARFTDGYGNYHFVAVEPLHDDAAIPEGTEVAILRRRDGALRAVPLGDLPA